MSVCEIFLYLLRSCGFGTVSVLSVVHCVSLSDYNGLVVWNCNGLVGGASLSDLHITVSWFRTVTALTAVHCVSL